MRDALDIYFLNQVVKTAKPKTSFPWTTIVDEIISTYSVPFDGGESIEAHIYAFKCQGYDFGKQLETLLSGGYITPSGKEDDMYILTKKGIAARKFDTVEDYENTILPKTLASTTIDNDKFNKEIISFLRKQPQKFGDISHIANEFINGDTHNKAQVIRQLHYLRDRDFIKIKDFPEDTMQLQEDWWGTLEGHNPIAGYKVEDLKAQLSTEYEKQSWWDRNKNIGEWIKIGVPCIFSYLLGLMTCNVSQSNTPSEKKDSTMHNEVSIAKDTPQSYGQTTNYDSLLHNKDTLMNTLTKPK